jgi:hypothetical protein
VNERSCWTYSDVARLTDQQGQDLQNARQYIVDLTEQIDGLREEVDRLTELVKLDAGTIRLREQEARQAAGVPPRTRHPSNP